MKLSVVVPCWNAEGTLGEQLAALAAQTLPPWEIVVADNGSTDGSRAVAAQHAEQLGGRLRWVDASDRRGPSHARNVGAQAATGDHLAFCDADDVVAPEWAASLVAAFERGERFLACRYDYRRFAPGSTRTEQVDGLQGFRRPFLPFAGAGGLAIEKSLHRAVGGFDETLTHLEDVDYCIRLQLGGARLVFVPDAVVHVRGRGQSPTHETALERRRSAYLHGYRWGRGLGEVHHRHRHHGLRLHGIPARAAVGAFSAARSLVTGFDPTHVWRLGWHVGALTSQLEHGVGDALPRLPAPLRKMSEVVARRRGRRRLARVSVPFDVTAAPALVFSPHEDDETLGCGGLIAQKRRLGAPVRVVFLTDGRACFEGRGGPATPAVGEIVAMRRREALAALATLGVPESDVVFLEYVDGTLSRLAGEARRAAVDALASLVARHRGWEVYLPYERDVHADHTATHALVRDALHQAGTAEAAWQYLVWALWSPERVDELARGANGAVAALPLAGDLGALRRRALRAYRSQLEPLPDGSRALPRTFPAFARSATREFFLPTAVRPAAFETAAIPAA